MLEDMRGLLQAAEEKRQASIAELSAKHQRVNLPAAVSNVVPRLNIKISHVSFPAVMFHYLT